MANGLYGTNIPVSIDNISEYVDIFYSYSPTYNSTDVESAKFSKLDANNLRNVISDEESDNVVEGMYNLKLPMDIFGKKGIYTIYIKPKEIPVTIMDVSTLRDFPNVRGMVFDSTELPSILQANNTMVGYRVIYLNEDGTRSSEVRIITSNNSCEPSTSVSTRANSNSYSYIYNENGSLTFATVTPSMPLSFKATSTPFIGRATQKAYLVNTLFEPIRISLEMTENDADTIATLIDGTQLRDLNRGIITTFNDKNQIVSQHEVSTLKESETGTPQYEIKEKRIANIDFTQTITDKID
jgi:hypothetical protein